ncbi:MAG: hypothetical protein Q9165_005541 [Trypethelium subeluteriae]
MATANSNGSTTHRAHYSPPWADTSIIGIAGSSGSGKTSLALAIDSFYKTLKPEESERAFRNEYDFDAPDAIDFDILVERLQEIKEGKKADIPVYSFEKHQRLEKTTTIYSPHVLILEGIFALHDQRVLDMLDLKIFADADADLCLSRRDIIVPRGIENKVAISMVSDRIRKTLEHKSQLHQHELRRLGRAAEDQPLSPNVTILPSRPQIVGLNTILLTPSTDREAFIFSFDRLATLLIESATALHPSYTPHTVTTPTGHTYTGLAPPSGRRGSVSAVVILRGGSALETGLKRVIPDCRTGRLLIQTSYRTGEPELHFRKLPEGLGEQALVLLLDAQMSSGGAALMAVRVLVDHGVEEGRIVYVAWMAGRQGLKRLGSVFPDVRVVVGRVVEDLEARWVEKKYLGC